MTRYWVQGIMIMLLQNHVAASFGRKSSPFKLCKSGTGPVIVVVGSSPFVCNCNCSSSFPATIGCLRNALRSHRNRGSGSSHSSRAVFKSNSSLNPVQLPKLSTRPSKSVCVMFLSSPPQFQLIKYGTHSQRHHTYCDLQVACSNTAPLQRAAHSYKGTMCCRLHRDTKSALVVVSS